MSKELAQAYKALYDLVGADYNDHFVLTSSGAEAVNHVIFASYLDITRRKGKNHFVTSALAEAAQILAIARLEEFGCIHTLVPPTSSGQITFKSICEAISPRTALISLPSACALTGVIQKEIPLIARLCKERDIILHIDATHSLSWGHFPWEGDILTFDGKTLGVPAVGGLFFRNHHDLSPFILGGDEQAGMRGGSFSEGGLFAMSEAALQLPDRMERAYLATVFEEELLSLVQDVRVLFPDEERLSHIMVLDVAGVHSESLHYLLQRRGVSCSIGGGHYQLLSHVLKVLGQETYGAISITLPPNISREGIVRMVALIADSVNHLRRYSHAL